MKRERAPDNCAPAPPRHTVARRLAEGGAAVRRRRMRGMASRRFAYGLKGRFMSFLITRLGAAAFAMGLTLAAGVALAQTAPAKPATPAPAAPGAQPAAPAPAPPSKVDLVSPEPQWVKLCGKEQTTGRDACQTMRDFGTSADQPPMISMQVFELQGEEKRKLRFMMLPIGMLLRPGFRVVVDKAEPIEGKYDMCFQNACTAEVEISPTTLSNMKKGQNLAVVMRVPQAGEPSGRELTLNIPLKDFG